MSLSLRGKTLVYRYIIRKILKLNNRDKSYDKDESYRMMIEVNHVMCNILFLQGAMTEEFYYGEWSKRYRVWASLL